MATFDWESEVRGWCHHRRAISLALTNSIVAFFRLSFQNTQCPESAWFGCQTSCVSVVVGGIWLAAINLGGTDRGVWLVVDQDPPQLGDLDYRPVKSTAGSEHLLEWAHADSPDVIPDVVACSLLWNSFRSATAWIQTSSQSAGNRDELQVGRQKRRLSEFWPDQSIRAEQAAAGDRPRD